MNYNTGTCHNAYSFYVLIRDTRENPKSRKVTSPRIKLTI